MDALVSSTNKTDRHDITEILLKVALNTNNHNPQFCFQVTEVYSTLQSDGTQVRITITLTRELPPTCTESIRVYNIIFKRFVLSL